ncbi:MAG: hypothetical protein ACE15D_04110 [Candidatus Eisenbacteria bacterium]
MMTMPEPGSRRRRPPAPTDASGRYPAPRLDAWALVIVCAALLLRLPLLPQAGYAPDLAYWKSWMSYASAYGIPHVYELELPGQTYPPVLLYLLGGLGHVYTLLVPSGEDSRLLTAFVKIPALLADLAVVALLARFAAARAAMPGRGARDDAGLGVCGAAALAAFHPALIWLSSYWGQIDALLGGLVAGAWLALLARRAALGGMLIALAVLTKPQGLIVLPPAIALAAATTGMRGLARSIAAGAATTVLVSAPFVLAGSGGKLAGLYLGSTDVYPCLSLNAWNPWWIVTLLSGGGRDAGLVGDARGPIPARLLGVALFLAATAWTCWRCARLGRDTAADSGEKRIERGMLLLTLQWLFFFLLPTQIHERYLVPALVSFAFPVVLRRRWFGAYAALSLAVLLNLLFVVPGSPVVLRIARVAGGEGVVVAVFLVGLAAFLIIGEVRGGRERSRSAAAGVTR